MGHPHLIEYVQTMDQPVVRPISSDWCELRLAHLRSADCAASAAQPGQDYIAVATTPAADCIAFAVCDGVSESYFGEVAARWIGAKVVRWLLELPIENIDEISTADDMAGFFHALPPIASEVVARHALPQRASTLVLEALDQKRRTAGSQSMFAGILATRQFLFIVRCGDVRIRILPDDAGAPPPQISLDAPRSDHRWSSLSGVRGSVEFAFLPAAAGMRIQCHSDGLAEHDGLLAGPLLNDPSLDRLIASTRSDPRSDDVSFVELTFTKCEPGPRRPFHGHMHAEHGAAPLAPAARLQSAGDAPLPRARSAVSVRRTALLLIGTLVFLSVIVLPTPSAVSRTSLMSTRRTAVKSF